MRCGNERLLAHLRGHGAKTGTQPVLFDIVLCDGRFERAVCDTFVELDGALVLIDVSVEIGGSLPATLSSSEKVARDVRISEHRLCVKAISTRTRWHLPGHTSRPLVHSSRTLV